MRSYPHKEEAAFVRLHALVRKGYRADLGVKDDTGLIRLEHPRGESAGTPDLLLCSDGRIIGTRPLHEGEGDPECLYVDSDADLRRFQSFLNGIPAPTLLQELNAWTVWELKMQIVLVVIYGAFAGGVFFLGKWLWHLVAP